MDKIEAGLDPLNWTIGVTFGMPHTYNMMIVFGPMYIILWR